MAITFPFLLFFLFFVFHSSEVRSETQQHPKDSLSIQEKLSKQLHAEEEAKFSFVGEEIFETEVLPSDRTEPEQEEEELGVVKILHPVRDFTLREKNLKVVVSIDGSPVRGLLPFPFILKLQLTSLNPSASLSSSELASSASNSSNLLPIIQTQTFTITEVCYPHLLFLLFLLLLLHF
jgi:hypothetical protein